MLFFLNSPARTQIYTLSLHDALPISSQQPIVGEAGEDVPALFQVGDTSGNDQRRPPPARLHHKHGVQHHLGQDRKSTRLNSSHRCISYAVFCLKKKKKKNNNNYYYNT